MAPSTLIRFQTKTELFCSGYGYRPHYNFENDHRKRTIRKRSPEWSDLKMMLFENAVLQCGRRKRCYLKMATSSKQTRPGARPLDRQYPKWRTDATMWLQFRANFGGRYIEMSMRRVHLSMRTEGIKAFSKRIRRCSVDGRKLYENGKCGRKSV